MDLRQRLAPLGYQRLRIFSCLGGDMPKSPFYAEVVTIADVFAFFGDFVRHVQEVTATDLNPAVISLVAAGRLLIGDLAGAKLIVENFPERRPVLDHGAGYCLTAPTDTLLHALPLPDDLRDTKRWCAGSEEQTRLLVWIEEHGSSLVWQQLQASYRQTD